MDRAGQTRLKGQIARDKQRWGTTTQYLVQRTQPRRPTDII